MKNLKLLILITLLLGCKKQVYHCNCVKYKKYWDGGTDTISTSSSLTIDKCSCNRNDTIAINIGDIITICK